MIDPRYCFLMAQYNAHQNNGIRRVVETMSMDDLTQDRGAYFGSIFETLNHLLWGDQLWLSRFAGTPEPGSDDTKGTDLMPTIATWGATRFRTDGQITEWTRNLKSLDLTGDMTWYSSLYDQHFSKSKALCVVHFFNHQTHHRGQIHAMLTGAGHSLPPTDLPLLPEMT